MSGVTSGEISRLLTAWNEGEIQALQELVPIVYPELRRIARRHLRRSSPDHTLESAALVNETYLKLVRTGGVVCRNREHFFAVCAQMIRHILVDHVRRGRYAKRGGGAEKVSLDQAALGIPAAGVDVLALDEALNNLARTDPRKVHVVEMRFFGGLSVEEISNILDISPETVMRDWRFAKAWLASRLLETSQASIPRELKPKSDYAKEE
jgi:RNA polymerase sigma-70 factor (ECF subfamily)